MTGPAEAWLDSRKRRPSHRRIPLTPAKLESPGEIRAVLLTDYGRGPELTDAPDPAPAANELLVHVHSSSVNGVDIAVAAGMLKDMMEFGPPITLGRDFSGVVEQVGADVERYVVGDEVYGFRHNPAALDGVWAEYIVEPEDMFVAAKPASLDFTQAGALPLAGVTALLAVDAIEPSHGEVVLVVGATGGVGGFAVELAAARGATVLATTKPGDEDRLRRLGASDVIDYTREDLTGAVRERHPEGVQGLVDALSFAEAFGARAELLAAGGRAASTLGAADVDQLAAQGLSATNVSAVPEPELLARLAEHADAGDLTVSIDKVYSFLEAPKALDNFRHGKRGKIALSVVSD